MTSVASGPNLPALLQSLATSNPTLYTHFTSLINYLVTRQPRQPFETIETIAAQLKKQLNNDISTTNNNKVAAADDNNTLLTLQNWLNESQYLFNIRPKVVKKPTNEEEEEDAATEEEETTVTEIPQYIPNLSSSFSLLSECGLSLLNEEILLLDRAIIAFTQSHTNIESVRFFGKIFTAAREEGEGERGDYYILEVKKNDYSEEEEQLRLVREKEIKETGEEETAADYAEICGSGVNEYIYYVTQSINQPEVQWVALPFLTPLELIAARSYPPRVFTGNLAASIAAYPGNEAHLLRGTIARITHSTVVVPQSSWKEEEGEVIIEDEEWKGVITGQIVEWIHNRGNIRLDGRVEPREANDQEEETADGTNTNTAALTENQKAIRSAIKAAQSETKIPLLRSATNDSHPIHRTCWTYRTHTGLDTGFRAPAITKPKEDEEEENAAIIPPSISHLISSAHSLLWPGAVNAVRGKEYVSVYIGWGLKKDRNAGYKAPAIDSSKNEFADPIPAKPIVPSEEEQQRLKEEEEEKKKEDAESEELEEEDDTDDLPDDEEETKEEED